MQGQDAVMKHIPLCELIDKAFYAFKLRNGALEMGNEPVFQLIARVTQSEIFLFTIALGHLCISLESRGAFDCEVATSRVWELGGSYTSESGGSMPAINCSAWIR